MKHRIPKSAVFAVGAICLAWGGQTLANGHCVTVAHDIDSGEKISMDPSLNFGADNSGFLASVYDALVDFDNDFNLIPRLALSWEANSDATQWTYTLRQGVKFHDGSDFDAADVVYTYKRLLDPEIGSPAAAGLGAFLEDIEVVDTHKVRFFMKKPTATAPVLLTNKWTYMVPEGATRERLQQGGVGTGAFIQESFTKGDPFNEIVRNPDYWEPGLPKAECLRFTVISEPITRAAALISGDIDIATIIDPELVGLMTKNENITTLTAPGGNPMVLNMLNDTPPFDDVRVRQALKLVVDRQAIVDGPLLGIGEPGNDNPVPPSSPVAYQTNVKVRDISKAKMLLAEAGYPDGIDVELYTGPIGVGVVNVAQAYVQMAAEAGIRVKINMMPSSGYWSEVWRKKPFSSSFWAARHPVEALSIGYRKEAKWNDTHWYRDDYDAMLDEANAAIDLDDRAMHLKRAQTLLSEEGGVIVPAFFPSIAAIRNECSGYQPHTVRYFFHFRDVGCTR